MGLKDAEGILSRGDARNSSMIKAELDRKGDQTYALQAHIKAHTMKIYKSVRKVFLELANIKLYELTRENKYFFEEIAEKL